VTVIEPVGEALTSLAFCWRVERCDGAGIALTSHGHRLDLQGVVHEPSPGMLPAAITRRVGLEPSSAEVSGALSSAAIGAGDLALGRWDGARVHLTAVDWSDGAAREVSLLAGELGNISISGNSFSAELQGAAAKLERPACPATSRECRAQFGDKLCRVDLAGRTHLAKIVETDGDQLTLDIAVDERFILGRLRYVTGANTGIVTIILAADGEQLRLRDLPRAAIEPGCMVEIREGCDKRFATCVERFANAANFRGEPHLPGTDHLTRYPGV
jgi:uncharacterized phage protein (TIGR02218 family)